MEQYNYNVTFEDYTKRHYRKNFAKKYKDKWDETENAIISVCEHIDNMLLHSRADLISTVGSYKLIKLDFAVAGTYMSPKASGNRCILFVNEDMRSVRILLVYSKDEICEPNETQKWKSIIQNKYEAIAQIFWIV